MKESGGQIAAGHRAGRPNEGGFGTQRNLSR
jgi:hypothetical protein